jgi:hypothetical protein
MVEEGILEKFVDVVSKGCLYPGKESKGISCAAKDVILQMLPFYIGSRRRNQIICELRSRAETKNDLQKEHQEI